MILFSDEACLLESKRTDVVKEFDKKLELEDKVCAVWIFFYFK